MRRKSQRKPRAGARKSANRRAKIQKTGGKHLPIFCGDRIFDKFRPRLEGGFLKPKERGI